MNMFQKTLSFGFVIPVALLLGFFYALKNPIWFLIVPAVIIVAGIFLALPGGYMRKEAHRIRKEEDEYKRDSATMLVAWAPPSDVAKPDTMIASKGKEVREVSMFERHHPMSQRKVKVPPLR